LVFLRSLRWRRKASGRRSGMGRKGKRVGLSPLRASPFPPLLAPLAPRTPKGRRGTGPGRALRDPKRVLRSLRTRPEDPKRVLRDPRAVGRSEGRRRRGFEGPVGAAERRRRVTAVRGGSCACAPPGTPGRRGEAPRTWTAPGAVRTGEGPRHRSLWPLGRCSWSRRGGRAG